MLEQGRNKLKDEKTPSHYSNEIDLIEVILSLKKKWKIILIITLLGTSIGVAYSLKVPKLYQPSTIITPPSEDVVERISNAGFVKYSSVLLFKHYYESVRSDVMFREFILSKKYLQQLWPDFNGRDTDKLLAEVTSSFNTEVLEPVPGPRDSEFVELPTRVQLKLKHSNEPALVELLSNYLEYVNTEQLQEMATQSESIRALRIEALQEKIEILREKALYERQLKIKKLEENNQLQIRKLEIERELLLELIAKDRQSNLASIKEAILIAKKLGIENPTPIEEFSASNRESATNIKLSAQQELPLYLMGTRYLNALTETLKSRKDEELSTKVNGLEKQIGELKLDPELAALKERKSDDPYIEGLSVLVNKVTELQKKKTTIPEVKLYTLQKHPSITTKNVGPSKILIIIVSLFISGFLGMIVAVFKAGVEKRECVTN